MSVLVSLRQLEPQCQCLTVYINGRFTLLFRGESELLLYNFHFELVFGGRTKDVGSVTTGHRENSLHTLCGVSAMWEVNVAEILYKLHTC